ncbi:hypothetical protein MTR_2g046090 [Medicago truncatula]|uniref:Uncharacterized protein n=1 Tax=Medicago truncatula TaxID=3880 RepID=A0A072VHU5_MEDTR|nr:hypothetical protein MTR_2g046090 [Medicago truncatula]
MATSKNATISSKIQPPVTRSAARRKNNVVFGDNLESGAAAAVHSCKQELALRENGDEHVTKNENYYQKVQKASRNSEKSSIQENFYFSVNLEHLEHQW